MAFPGSQKGTVQIMVGSSLSCVRIVTELNLMYLQDLVATVSPEKAATEVLINAHQHDISCISMNQQGTMIATCSSKVSL